MTLFIAVTCFIAITVSCVATTTVDSQALPKCCNADEVFEKVNSTYKCSEDNTKRLQVNTEQTGFWHNNNNTGECVEVLQKDFYVFNVSDKVVQTKRQSSEEIFPKCCPLNYLYNPLIHSCEEQQYLNHSYIEQSLLKIGLPNCRVVLDHTLKDSTDFQYGLLDSDLLIDRRNHMHSSNSYCIDQTIGGVLKLRECKDSLNVCEEIRCFKKCCPDGQSFINGDICNDTYRYGLNLSKWASVIENHEAPHALIYNSKCDTIFFMPDNKYTFTIDSKGVFSYRTNFTPLQIDEIWKMDSYCMEHTFDKSQKMNDYYLFKCFDADNPDAKFYYTGYAFIFSSVALVLTIAAYIILNEISKVFGKILVLYCINMLVLSSTLTYNSFNNINDDGDCEIVAFTLIFFGAASFTWANVLCWDIWCKLVSMYIIGNAYLRSKNKTKMLVYISYGWGIPLLLTVIILLFHKFDDVLPSVIQPYVGHRRCFFDKIDGNYAKTLFFLVPLLMMEILNIFLFVKTASYCWKVRKEISNMNESVLLTDKVKNYKKNKKRLFVILKLSVIMGISFIFEVGSAFVDMARMGPIPRYIQMVWDIINALQGVYIFLIFICKKKVLLALWSKLMKVKSPQGSSSTRSSQTNNGVSLPSLDAIVTKNGK